MSDQGIQHSTDLTDILQEQVPLGEAEPGESMCDMELTLDLMKGASGHLEESCCLAIASPTLAFGNVGCN